MNLTSRNIALFAAMLLTVVLSACQHPKAAIALPPAPKAAQPASVPKRPDVVGIGDLLDIYVMEDSSFNGQFPVRDSGNIIMPRIGRIYLAGSSLTDAQDIVRKRVQSDQIKKATVIVERVRTAEQASLAEMPKILIFVSGAVNKPGQHRVALSGKDGLSAFEALMIAGGPSTFADQHRAYVLRKAGNGERTRIPVDLLAISHGDARDLQLQEGDVIVVPQRRFGL